MISLKRDFEEKLAEKKGKFLENARNEADFRAKNEILEKNKNSSMKSMKKQRKNRKQFVGILFRSYGQPDRRIAFENGRANLLRGKRQKLISDILRKKVLRAK